MTTTSTKEEKLINVAQSAMKLILLHGLDGITHSRLARSAGVSRPWLYKYVGQNKQDIVPFAVDHFGKYLAYMDRPTETTREGWIEAIVNGTDRLISIAQEHPWMLQLYFRYLGMKNPMGERIEFIRNMYLAKATQELMSAYKYSETRARHVAEAVTNYEMSTAYHWIQTPPREGDAYRKEVLIVTRKWLENIGP